MTPTPRTYLDWNATAPLHPAARAAMLSAMDVAGNPSSPHAEGRRARSLLEAARESVALALGMPARSIYFTSGATEAANWMLCPERANRVPLRALLVSATEHACVLAGHRFAPEHVHAITVDGEGRINAEALGQDLARLNAQLGPGGVMVAVQSANNETGVLQPLDAIAAACATHGALFVCDAVQSVGRGVALPRADAVFLSAHKLGGPKGIGALIVPDETHLPAPLVRGGGQERRQRSGTENVIGAAGFAAALTAVIRDAASYVPHTGSLRDRLEATLRDMHPHTRVFGSGADRVPNTTAFAVPGVTSEMALVAMDLAGVALSSGSACSSGKVAASHVLAAMGVSADEARGALRVSTGLATTTADVDRFLDAWSQFLSRRAQRAVA
jgi:cysteine desulfurase